MVSDPTQFSPQLFLTSLNPCSNGIWSLTHVGLCHCNAGSIGLNPCSNGIWSLTFEAPAADAGSNRLNPCSNGIWSLTCPSRLERLGRSVS